MATLGDDWRLRIDLHEDGVTSRLLERVDARELEHDLSTAFHDRIVISRDGAEVFCYAGTRDQAERAEQLIRSIAADHGWRVDTELRRWHPTAEDWEDPDTPLPEDDTERASERAALMAREREESETQGYPDFEVRVQSPSQDDAARLAERLRNEGLPSVRRSHYLLVGVTDEDSADALAQRLSSEAPPGSVVTVEATGRAVRDSLPPNPFAIFGGLGV